MDFFGRRFDEAFTSEYVADDLTRSVQLSVNKMVKALKVKLDLPAKVAEITRQLMSDGNCTHQLIQDQRENSANRIKRNIIR